MGEKQKSINTAETTTKDTTHENNSFTKLFEKLGNSNISEWSFGICATQENTVTTGTGYEYQPGGLYAIHENGFNALLSHTPNSDTGVNLSSNTELVNIKHVSDNFYYHIYELVERSNDGEVLSEQDIEHKIKNVHVSERYHLREILYTLFESTTDSGMYTDMLIKKSVNKIKNEKY